MSEFRILGSFAKEVKRKNSDGKSMADVYSVTKYDGFVRSLDYFKKQVFSRDLSMYKLVKSGEFAYSTIHLEEGALGLLEDDQALISPMYTIFSVDETIDKSYLSYLLRSQDLVNKYGLIGQGSVNRRKSVPFSSLAKLKIFTPPLPEQKKIAEILSGIDRLIKTHSAKKSKMSDLLVAMRARIFTNASGKEVSLGELCSPKQWPTISADQITETGYPVYGANGQIGFYSEYNHQDPVLAVTCRGATCGNLNLIPGFSYVTGNSMCLDNLSEDISIQYLYHFLTWRGLNDVISGSAQPQITRTPLQAVQIVVPAKQRQSEVVSMLAATATLHDHEKEMIARLENLKNAVSIDLLSGRKRVTI